MARQLEEATERPILNPRDVGAVSLLMMDEEWLVDMDRHRQWLKYKEDELSRPALLR